MITSPLVFDVLSLTVLTRNSLRLLIRPHLKVENIAKLAFGKVRNQLQTPESKVTLK